MTIHEELAEARYMFERLTSRSLVLQGGGHKDATQYEIGVLKREIAFHETTCTAGAGLLRPGGMQK